MGWSSGSSLFSDVIITIKRYVGQYKIRRAIYYELIQTFEDRDADTLDECLGIDEAYDEAYRSMY